MGGDCVAAAAVDEEPGRVYDPGMRRAFKIAGWFVVLLLVILATTAFVLYRGTQHVPEFYAQALAPTLPPAEQVKLGDEFERETLELHNHATQIGRWEATFTDDEVNAWLANQLPQNYPRALPPGVGSPRVQISPALVQVACRYEGEPFQAVISLAAEVHLTDKPNQVAIRVRSIRAGWVPLPLKQFLDTVTEAARRNGLELVWSQTDGDPVALFQIPSRHAQYQYREIRIDTIEVQDGKLRLGGHTDYASDG